MDRGARTLGTQVAHLCLFSRLLSAERRRENKGTRGGNKTSEQDTSEYNYKIKPKTQTEINTF